MGLLASATAQSVSQELIASRLRERVGLRVRSCVQSRVWHEAAANRRPIVGSTLVYAQPQCRVFCPKFKTLGGHRRADPATRMGEGGRAGARAQGAADAGTAAAGDGTRGRRRAGQAFCVGRLRARQASCGERGSSTRQHREHTWPKKMAGEATEAGLWGISPLRAPRMHTADARRSACIVLESSPPVPHSRGRIPCRDAEEE